MANGHATIAFAGTRLTLKHFFQLTSEDWLAIPPLSCWHQNLEFQLFTNIRLNAANSMLRMYSASCQPSGATFSLKLIFLSPTKPERTTQNWKGSCHRQNRKRKTSWKIWKTSKIRKEKIRRHKGSETDVAISLKGRLVHARSIQASH